MRELAIHHIPANGDSHARVRVSYRPEAGAQVQEREADFDFSLSQEQQRLIQWYLEEYLIYPWGEWRTRAQETEALMTRLGKEMFRAVFSSEDTRALYAHVADKLSETRVVIQASDPVGIALPWELLRDPTRGEYGDLASLAYTFVRSQSDLIFEPPPEPTGDTFNILMVISRPGGPEGDVPFQSVARPLLELFREHRERIRLDVLRPPTFEKLARVLSEKPNYYHVLHFDGHGTFPQASNGTRFYAQRGQEGLLIFEGEDDKLREVSGKELGALLAGKGVPVVLLNACQSGMTYPESLYPSVGNELLKAGCRGVVAMAYSVYVQTAMRFMARLYEGLINGEELGRAVALGRDELRAHPQRISPIGEIELDDWVVPVMFEAAPVRAIQPRKTLHLDLNSLQDQQAQAGKEIGCPEPPVFGFVGRDSVVLELERAFQDETIVLLQGMAGVGKTEMALGFARWLAETGGLDGPIFFFHFEHYLPLAQVCDRVGQEFNLIIRQQLEQDWHLLDPQQRREVALGVLRQVPCLMIWDNFEPVAGFPEGSPTDWKPVEQQELHDFLRKLGGGRTKVLLTSRRDEAWLGAIYRQVELGGLRLLEAQELAVRVMSRAGLQPEDINSLPQYNDLLHYLKGNPLAIQVILPELKRKSPDELLSALKTGEATFGEDDPTLGRERSLTASLTYRLDALDPELYQRLGILALFQGFVDAAVLDAICQAEGAPALIAGLGRDEWISILNSAAEVGLVRRVGEGYYNIHPALPWFFHDLLREAFPEQSEWLEQAYCTVYGRYGIYLDDLFQTNTELAVNQLGAEEANFRIALRLAREGELWELVAVLTYGIQRLMTIQGRWVEWERMVAELEGETEDENGEPLPGKEELWRVLLGHRAQIATYRRDFETSKTIHLRLKEYYEGVGDEKNVAVTFHQMGNIAQEQLQFEEAERWYRQSLEIKARIGNEHGQAQTLANLGMIAGVQGKFDEAERWCRQSLEIEERIGDERGQAQTLHNLGNIALEQRQFDEAERWYRQSLKIAEHIGDEYSQAGTLHQLGIISQERRQFVDAERWYRRSLKIKAHIGDERGRAQTLHQLGMIAQKRHQFDEAERWCRQSLDIKVRIGDERGQAITLHQLGMIAQEQGRLDEAECWYRQSMNIKARVGDVHMQASTLHQLGMVAEERRQFDEAERLYRQSLEISECIGNEHGQASTLHQLGMISEEQENIAQAIKFYKRAEAIYERLNDLHNMEIVRKSLSRVQGQNSDSEMDNNV